MTEIFLLLFISSCVANIAVWFGGIVVVVVVLVLVVDVVVVVSINVVGVEVDVVEIIEIVVVVSISASDWRLVCWSTLSSENIKNDNPAIPINAMNNITNLELLLIV